MLEQKAPYQCSVNHFHFPKSSKETIYDYFNRDFQRECHIAEIVFRGSVQFPHQSTIYYSEVALSNRNKKFHILEVDIPFVKTVQKIVTIRRYDVSLFFPNKKSVQRLRKEDYPKNYFQMKNDAEIVMMTMAINETIVPRRIFRMLSKSSRTKSWTIIVHYFNDGLTDINSVEWNCHVGCPAAIPGQSDGHQLELVYSRYS